MFMQIRLMRRIQRSVRFEVLDSQGTVRDRGISCDDVPTFIRAAQTGGMTWDFIENKDPEALPLASLACPLPGFEPISQQQLQARKEGNYRDLVKKYGVFAPINLEGKPYSSEDPEEEQQFRLDLLNEFLAMFPGQDPKHPRSDGRNWLVGKFCDRSQQLERYRSGEQTVMRQDVLDARTELRELFD